MTNMQDRHMSNINSIHTKNGARGILMTGHLLRAGQIGPANGETNSNSAGGNMARFVLEAGNTGPSSARNSNAPTSEDKHD